MPSTMSEKVTLLGKGLYADIPDEITITSIPTVSELEYVSGEDFDATMLDKILPSAIVEDISCKDLLEIDYNWLCRCLRFLNFGPYYTTNAIYCSDCHKTSYGEYIVDLRTINVKALPDGFVNEIKISRDEFLDFEGDVIIKLPTIQDKMNWEKDKAFLNSDGSINKELGRICYMIKSIKGKSNLTPIEVKLLIQQEMSPADYVVLKNEVLNLSDYGLRAGGIAHCPNCGNKEAAFIALTNDKFFRPTLGDLRRWKLDRGKGSDENLSGDKTAAI